MGKSSCVPFGILIIAVAVTILYSFTNPKISLLIIAFVVILIITQRFLDTRRTKRPLLKTMNEDYLELLKSADSAVYAGYLPGFNIKKADAKFNRFVKALEQCLGCALPDKDNYIGIQDAGFHGMLFLPYQFLTEEYQASVRVSNFGSFATVYDYDEVVQPQTLSLIKDLLAEFGYIYIPTKVLNEPYTGKNPGVDGFHSWGHRYFDWT